MENVEKRTEIHQKIWSNLELIQNKINLSDDEMCELLGTKISDFRLAKVKKRAPPLLALVRLSRRLNLELTHLYFDLPVEIKKTYH